MYKENIVSSNITHSYQNTTQMQSKFSNLPFSGTLEMVPVHPSKPIQPIRLSLRLPKWDPPPKEEKNPGPSKAENRMNRYAT